MIKYNTVFIPARPQPDTIIGIYLLYKYGGEEFSSLDEAKIEIRKFIPEGETQDSLREKGVLLFDLGGGIFDHHSSTTPTTVSLMVAKYLNILRDESIQKLLTLAKRDDMYGKGTLSKDPIDRAFGLSGLLTTLNKNYPEDPTKVFRLIFPLIASHHKEEVKRCFDMPNELKDLKERGLFADTVINNNNFSLKIAFAETDNPNFAGYLRSNMGGSYDLVVIFNSSGHTNILTKQSKKIDLRKIVSSTREKEMELRKILTGLPFHIMSMPGVMPDVTNWYYDTATNTLQNGGVNKGEIEPTLIPKEEIIQITIKSFSLN